MKVAIRVEGNKKLGLGHVIRCLSIAKQLKKNSVKVIFIISDSGIKKIIEDRKYQVFMINKKNQESAAIKKILVNEQVKIIVFDSKKKTLSNILKEIPSKIKIVFVDNTRYQNEVDLIVLPGIKEQFIKYPKNSIYGLEYVLLNPSIRRSSRRKEKNTILLSTGGSDKYNITEKVVSKFLKLNAEFKMKIVLGKFYKEKDKIKTLIECDERFQVYDNPKNVTEIMNSCVVGIITFGITVYEAAYLRLPVFVISHSNENHKAALKVEQYGWSKYLGKYNEIEYQNMCKKILKYLHNKKSLQKMIKAGKIVDGKGNIRVVNNIMKLI